MQVYQQKHEVEAAVGPCLLVFLQARLDNQLLRSKVARQLQQAEHVEYDLGRRVGGADYEVGRVEQAKNVDNEAE